MRPIMIFLLLFSHLFFQSKGWSQVAEEGKQPTGTPALGNSQSFYMKSMQENTALYTGHSYVGERFTQGHAFFKESGWNKGAVLYRGIYYEDFPLLYDLVKDELVILYFDGSSKMTLFSGDVQQFTLLGHTFVRLPDARAKGKDISAGFYDQLYKGETEVLVKRTKTIKEDISSGAFKRFPKEDNRFYLKKENAFYHVKRRGSVLRVFKDKRKEIRRFLKEKDLQFYKDPEAAIVEMAQYYDQLTNGL